VNPTFVELILFFCRCLMKRAASSMMEQSRLHQYTVGSHIGPSRSGRFTRNRGSARLLHLAALEQLVEEEAAEVGRVTCFSRRTAGAR
jgi:hypothetical protein